MNGLWIISLFNGFLDFIILFVLWIVVFLPSTGAEFETALGTYFLKGLQKLKLFCVAWAFMVYRLGLGKLISLCEFLFLFRIFLQFPQRFSSVFHFFRVGVELLDSVLNEIVCFIVLSASFVWTLLGEHWLLRLGRIISNLEQFFLYVVGWALFVKREGVWVVNWSTVA